MEQTKQDIERRERLHEWFKSDPEIWNDLEEEMKISWHNENVKLRSRNAENREWSSGWVASHEFIMDFKRYYKKLWNLPTIKK